MSSYIDRMAGAPVKAVEVTFSEPAMTITPGRTCRSLPRRITRGAPGRRPVAGDRSRARDRRSVARRMVAHPETIKLIRVE
jgi:hypothetical protein